MDGVDGPAVEVGLVAQLVLGGEHEVLGEGEAVDELLLVLEAVDQVEAVHPLLLVLHGNEVLVVLALQDMAGHPLVVGLFVGEGHALGAGGGLGLLEEGRIGGGQRVEVVLAERLVALQAQGQRGQRFGRQGGAQVRNGGGRLGLERQEGGHRDQRRGLGQVVERGLVHAVLWLRLGEPGLDVVGLLHGGDLLGLVAREVAREAVLGLAVQLLHDVELVEELELVGVVHEQRLGDQVVVLDELGVFVGQLELELRACVTELPMAFLLHCGFI